MLLFLFTQFLGGTGLGLFSLSKRLDALGGNYGVMKRRDGAQGSIFWFEFPYKPDEECARNSANPQGLTSRITSRRNSKSPSSQHHRIIVPSPMQKITASLSHLIITAAAASPKMFLSPTYSHSQHSSGHTPKNALNILLVDDSLSIQKMTSIMLRKQGCLVTVADNGAEALEIVTAKYREREAGLGVTPFDLVLMDFQMPVMDGLESTRRIRELEASLSAKDHHSVRQYIVGLSANTDDDTLEFAAECGVDESMEKPFTLMKFNKLLGSFHRHGDSPLGCVNSDTQPLLHHSH